MEDKTKSDDLYEELRKTLENESAEEKPAAADDQKSTSEKTDEKEITENGEITEEEISKLHPKAQKRIKDLAAEIKRLAELPKEIKEESKTDKEIPDETKEPKFGNVREFLDAVQDEPSRKLLEKFYGVIKGEISTTLSPIEKSNNTAKFNEEFAKYEKIEGLADYKNDLLKRSCEIPINR